MKVLRVCGGYVAVLEEFKPAGMPTRWQGELRTADDESIKEWIHGATSRQQNYGYPITTGGTELEVVEALTRRAEQLVAMQEEAVAQ